MLPFLLPFETPFPKVEAGPEEKRNDGERQAQGEVYLDGVEAGIGVWPFSDRTVRLEDGGAHERLKRVGNNSGQLMTRPMLCKIMETPATVMLCALGLPIEKYDLQI